MITNTPTIVFFTAFALSFSAIIIFSILLKQKPGTKFHYSRLLVPISIVTVAVLFIFYVSSIGEPESSIDLGDIIGEGALVVLALFWIAAVQKVSKAKRIYYPLVFGSILFMLGTLEDLLGEFYEFDLKLLGMEMKLENLIALGVLLGTFGFFYWVKEVLKDKNKAIDLHKQIEAKKAEIEAKMILEEEQSEQMLNTIGEGIMITDDEGEMTYINPALEDMFGFNKLELIGLSPSDFFKAYDLKEKPLSPELLSNSAAVTAAKQEIRALIENKDKKKIAVIMNSAPIYIDNQFKGVVRVVHNYSDELFLQRQKDDFFSIASHELRTPLTVISGNLDILRGDYLQEDSNPETKQILNDTLEASDRLTKMVSDFLNVSRLDQGRLSPKMEKLDACQITESTINELKPLADKKRITLSYSCAKDHGKALADEGLLKEIIINLVGNSIKFTSKGGVTVTHSREGNFVTTTVTDTGAGIAEKMQPLLFRRFQQAMKRTLARQAGGTGLGLYISREFARMMGGDLYLLKSGEGKGSTFKFTVPLVSDETPIANQNQKSIKSNS